MLLGCCGAGGPAPPVLAPVLGGVRLGICNLLGCFGAGACSSLLLNPFSRRSVMSDFLVCYFSQNLGIGIDQFGFGKKLVLVKFRSSYTSF